MPNFEGIWMLQLVIVTSPNFGNVVPDRTRHRGRQQAWYAVVDECANHGLDNLHLKHVECHVLPVLWSSELVTVSATHFLGWGTRDFSIPRC